MARVRGTTTERGYGYGHQQARAHALRQMEDGTPCPRCARPMWRNQAKHLDLDHTDDRTGYRGLAHARCNRQAGGKAKAMRYRKRKQQQRQPQAQPTPRSRNW